jgi:hypothetical protein
VTEEEWAAVPPYIRSAIEGEGYSAANVVRYEVTSSPERQTVLDVRVLVRPGAEKIKVEFVSDSGALKRRD